ncbi:MAG TPA: sigma-54 dependent transcriptional regulator [Spirochaetales bacterium]|nr:sigma-54 dependent transcriptional regulator [Spirochaetales bacterium]HRZ64890.1 sigma-54 dependent transcriptional regulator [Spirochaetia bacterium]
MGTFLIVDGDADFSADICQFFGSIGHSLYRAADFQGALLELSARAYDLVVSNVRLPGGGAIDLSRAMRKAGRDAELIVYADIDSAPEGLRAVKEGAFCLLQKPFSLPELNFQARRALLDRGSRRSASPGMERLEGEAAYRPYNFIGESEEIRKVFKIVNRVARTNVSTLLLGETGTGKELVAGAIHYNSLRSGGPFIRVNCAALPEQLLESELFGHEKGAFTGADRMREGRFERADGGTIFLDEVADMSLMTQAKVLRVLQEKSFERLGSSEPVKTDVRVISATNRDLTERMREGQFREDLFYRLNGVTIRLPPLRAREGDLALLVQFFLKKATLEMGKAICGIEPGAMDMLLRYRWPGNIRELENVIERAVVMAEGEIVTAEDLDLLFAGSELPAAGQVSLPPGGVALADAERQLIEQALERCGWVQKKAAELLGVSERVLSYKIKNLEAEGGLRRPGSR